MNDVERCHLRKWTWQVFRRMEEHPHVCPLPISSWLSVFSYQWDLLLAGPCRRMSAGSWLTWALIAAQLEIWPTFFRSGTGHRCCFSCRFCLWLDSGPFYGLSFGSAFTDANVSGRVPVNLEIRMHHNTRSLKIDCFPNWKKKIWIYDI